MSVRKMIASICQLVLLLLCNVFFSFTAARAQANAITTYERLLNSSSGDLVYPKLVKRFYELSQNRKTWFLPGESALILRKLLKDKIDSAGTVGLRKERYHTSEINRNVNANFTEKDSLAAFETDKIFTDAAIAYAKDLYQGYGITGLIMYDELTPLHDSADNAFLLNSLANMHSALDLISFFNSLEPTSREYQELKNELSRNDSLTSLQKRKLTSSLNLYRWMHHFRFPKWIVVNIASARLRYYEYDSVQLGMKVVVGKPSTRTPRFAAHCNQVILYPYWNVPQSIALNELLPQFRRHPSNVDALNMQIIDSKGNIVDHHKLNWKNYSKNYFPFHIRQSTGCDNSLGVIKFNLTSPYSVYLHDTNYKGAFILNSRYLSHGCIRLEKPIELADHLLPRKIDDEFLAACLKDQVPVPIDLLNEVPVIVTYQTVELNEKNKLTYFKDVYNLLN